MSEFVFKRMIPVAEYYRITAEDEGKEYKKIKHLLDLLVDRITLFQDEHIPPERVVGLDGNEE